MSKKVILILIAAAVVIGLALPKILGQKKDAGLPKDKPGVARTSANTKDSQSRGRSVAGKGAAVAVTAMILKPQRLTEKIVSPGTVLANEWVEIKSEIAGRLLSLNVKEGSRVAKGTVLAKINDAELQAQLLKATANLKLALGRESRQKGLLEKEAISQEVYESTIYDLESAKADIALITAQIEKTELRAPFNGQLGLKYVSQGAYLSPGATVTTLVNDRPLKVEFSVPEKYAVRIKNGDKVLFATQGGIPRYTGTVYALDPMIDENTRTLRMRAICTNPDERIRPGAFAELTLTLGENDLALMVPSPALVPDATGQKIFCIKGGTAVPVPVITGVRDSAMVEVTSGLQPGDTIITRGVLLVQPGISVDITSWE